MSDKKDYNLEDLYTNTLLEAPKAYNVRGQLVFIYPATLGTTTLVANKLKLLDINQTLLATEPAMELLRLATVKPDETAMIIAFRACNGKDEIYSQTFIDKWDFFKNIDREERAVLLEIVLQPDKTKELLHELNIDRELNSLRIARKSKKKDRNNLTFGAVSIYGSLIDPACEKYGWSYDYVLWGISYTNLQLLMADASKELYLTDKESKHATILPHGNNIKKVEGMSKEEIRERFYKK